MSDSMLDRVRGMGQQGHRDKRRPQGGVVAVVVVAVAVVGSGAVS